MHNLPTRLSSLFLASAVLLSWAGLSPALASSYLRGNVQHDDTLNNQPAPGLSRGDMNKTDDAFSDPNDQAPDTGTPDFSVRQSLPPPPPKKPFNLAANDQGGGFDGQYGQGIPAQVPQQQQQQMPPQQMNQMGPGPQFQPENAEPDLQLQWDAWHQRLATAIYQRYTMLTRTAGYGMRHRMLLCNISYVVTRDGRIVNAQMLTPSPDPVYNTLCMGAITSLSGNIPLLAFPPGSRRMMVEKPANFGENLGHEGFTTITGDHETVKGGRH